MKNFAKILLLVLTVAALVGCLVFAVSAETEPKSGFKVSYTLADGTTGEVNVASNDLATIWTDNDGLPFASCVATSGSRNYTSTAATATTARINSITLLGTGETYSKPYITISDGCDFTLDLGSGNTLVAHERFEVAQSAAQNETVLRINGDSENRSTITNEGGKAAVQLMQLRSSTSLIVNNVDFSILSSSGNFHYDANPKLVYYNNCNIETTKNITFSPGEDYVGTKYVFEDTNYSFVGTGIIFSAATGSTYVKSSNVSTVSGPKLNNFDIYFIGDSTIDTTASAYTLLSYQGANINANYGFYWAEGTQSIYVESGVKLPTDTLNVLANTVANTEDDAPYTQVANDTYGGADYATLEDPETYILWECDASSKKMVAYTGNDHVNDYTTYNNNCTYTTYYADSIAYDVATNTATVGTTSTEAVIAANGDGYIVLTEATAAKVVNGDTVEYYAPGASYTVPTDTVDVVATDDGVFTGATAVLTDSEGNTLSGTVTLEAGKTYTLSYAEGTQVAAAYAITNLTTGEVYYNADATTFETQFVTYGAGEYHVDFYEDITVAAAMMSPNTTSKYSVTFDLNGNTLNANANIRFPNGQSGTWNNNFFVRFEDGDISMANTQVFQFRPGMDVEFEGITLTTGTGYINDGGVRSMTFKNCTINTGATNNFISNKDGRIPSEARTYTFDGVTIKSTAKALIQFNSNGFEDNNITVKFLGNCDIDLTGILVHTVATAGKTAGPNSVVELYEGITVNAVPTITESATDGTTTFTNTVKYVKTSTYEGELDFMQVGENLVLGVAIEVTIDGVTEYYPAGTVIPAEPTYTDELVAKEDGLYYVGTGYTDAEGNQLDGDVTLVAGQTYVFTTDTVYKKADVEVAFTVEVNGELSIYTDPTLTHEFVLSLNSTSEYTIIAYTDLYLYGLDADRYNAYRVKFHNNFNGTIDLNGNTLFWGDKDKTRPATVEAGNDSNAASSKETTITIKNGTVSTAGYTAGTYQIRPNKNIVFTDVDFDFTTRVLGINDGGFKSFTLNNCTVTYEGKVSTFIATKTAYDVEGTREINLNTVTVVINNFSTPGAAFVSLTDNGKKDNVTVNVSGDCVFANMYVVTVSATNKSGTNTATINFGEGMTVGRDAFWSDNDAPTWTVTTNYVKADETSDKDVVLALSDDVYVLTSEYDYTVTTAEGVVTAYLGTEFETAILNTKGKSGSTLTLYSDMTFKTRVQKWNTTGKTSVTIDLGGKTIYVTEKGQLDLGNSGVVFTGMTVTFKNGNIDQTGSTFLMSRPGMEVAFEDVNYKSTGLLIDDRGVISFTYTGGSINSTSNIINAQFSTTLEAIGVTARNYTFDGVEFKGNFILVKEAGYYNDTTVAVGDLEINVVNGCSFENLTSGLVTWSVRDPGTNTFFLSGNYVLNVDMDTKVENLTGIPAACANEDYIVDGYAFTVNFNEGETTYKKVYVDTDGTLSPLTVKSNLTLFTDFNLNFFLPQAAGVTSVVVGETEVYFYDTEVGGVAYTKFAITGIAANKAAEEVTFVVTYEGGVTVTGTYSIVDYATALLYGTYSDASKSLVKSAMAYVEAAYTYAGETVPAMVEALAAYEGVIVENQTADDIADIGTANIAVESATYSLASETKLILNLKDTYTGTLTVDGVEYAVEAGVDTATGLEYIVVVTRAYNLYDTTHAITGDGINGEYNLATYIVNVKGADANLDTLVNALYTYAYYASAYKATGSLN